MLACLSRDREGGLSGSVGNLGHEVWLVGLALLSKGTAHDGHLTQWSQQENTMLQQYHCPKDFFTYRIDEFWAVQGDLEPINFAAVDERLVSVTSAMHVFTPVLPIASMKLHLVHGLVAEDVEDLMAGEVLIPKY